MTDRIKNTFKHLMVSLQMAKLYGVEHPKFDVSIEKAFNSFQEIFSERPEFTIGIVGEEVAFEKEIFFELSKIMTPVIGTLKEKKIEKLVFSRQMELNELKKFIIFLTGPKDPLKKNPQEQLNSLGIRNISCGRLMVSGAAPISQEEGKTIRNLNYLNLYKNSLDQFSDTIDTILTGKSIDYFNLKINVNNMFDKLMTQYQDLLKLTTVKKYDMGTFVHILNVSILAMYFSHKLGFSKDDVLEFGIAGLFHDIGKIYISRKIITKPARLTDEEFTKMKSHVTLGSLLLLKYIDTLGTLPVVVAFEHHLKFDLSGYPKIAIRKKPHDASLIVSICDVYDALTQKRSYKNDYPPKMIYEIMIKDKGTAFDPELLDSFFKVMGVWPIGTIVALTDDRIAIVREENETDIFNPKVEIVNPKGTTELFDLKEQKETVQIKQYLNPFTEGKPYVDLV
jgi:HD-GYP domain-containing protein (c-di-GMP phosphodiesterase class II)